MELTVRHFRAALIMLMTGIHLTVATLAHGQAGFDLAGIQACTSAASLISDIRSRSLSLPKLGSG